MKPTSTRSRVGRNALVLISGNMISRIIGVATYILLARYLGPKEYGVYNIAISFVQIFVLFANFGLDVTYIREVSRDNTLASRHFYSGMMLKTVLSLASFGVMVAVVFLFDYDPIVYWAIIVYGFGILFQAAMELITSVYKAFESMAHVGYIMVLRSVVAIALIALLVLAGGDVMDVLIAQNISFLGVVVLFYVILGRQKIIRFKPQIDLGHSRTMLIASIPFVAIGIVHIINIRLDIIMLSILTNETLAGYYSAANEFILPLFILPNLLSTALFPALSKHFGRDTSAIAELSNFSLKILITLGVPMGIGLFVLAPQIVDLVLGAQYADSVVVMRILGLGIMLTYSRVVFSWVLTAINLEKFVLREYLLSLAVNVPLNLLLIPRYGIAGSAVATAASSIVGLIYLYVKSRQAIPAIVLFKNFAKPLLAGGVMGGALFYGPQLNVFVMVLCGCLIFGAATLLLKIYSRDELQLLFSSLKRS